MPDLKYMDANIAKIYSNAPDYFTFASEVIKEMVRQVGKPSFDDKGIMTKGVIVRHLTLPGYLEDSKNIIEDPYINLWEFNLYQYYEPIYATSSCRKLSRAQ